MMNSFSFVKSNLNRRNLVSIGIGIAVSASLFLAFKNGHLRLPPRGFVNVSCHDHGYVAQIEVTSHIVLNKKFLADSSDSRVFQSAINEQLQFLQSQFNAESKNIKEEEWKHFSVSHQPAEIKITSVSDTAYGQDLKIDFESLQPLEQMTIYMQKAVANGQTKNTDPAVKVDYTAKLTVGACTQHPLNRQNKVPFVLPKDPYLAYWYVPIEYHQMVTWGKVRRSINPCATQEYADVFRPNYFWYFWKPNRNERFDCKEVIPESALVHSAFEIQSTIVSQDKEQSSIYLGPLLKKEKLKAAVFFGWTNTQTIASNDRPRLLKVIDHHKRGEQVTSGQVTFDDLASLSLIRLFMSMQRVMNVDDIAVLESGRSLVVTLTGQLLMSQRPFTLELYWGPTDELGLVPTEHKPFWTSALKTADFVFYAGHSGLGLNLDLSGTSNTELRGPASDFDQSDAPLSHQVVGIISCYSFNYFSPTLFPRPARVTFNFTRQFIYTASEFSPSERFFANAFTIIDSAIYRKMPFADGGIAELSPKNYTFLSEVHSY